MTDGQAPARGAGSLRKSLFWASFGQVGFFVAQFASSIVLARLLSPREMGVFAIGVATVGLVSIFQALGLNNYLISAEKVERPLVSTVFTINFVLSLILGVAIVGLGFFSGQLFEEPGTVDVMLWLASTPIINAIGMVPASLMQREGDFRSLSMLRIGSTVIGTALTVVLAFMGFSYMSLAYGWVLTCAVNSFGACAVAPRHVHLRLGIEQWRKVTAFGSQMILINGTTQFQRQALNLTLGHILGLSALGLFQRANSLFSLLYDNIQTIAARVFIVDFAEAARRGEGLQDRYRQVADFTSALLWPIFAGLAVVAAPLVHFLYGEQWDSVALPLSLLCFTGILWVAVSLAWELFVIAGETGLQAKLEIVRAVFGVVIFAIGCTISLNAAAATRIIESVLVIFLYMPHILRITGAKLTALIPIYVRNVLLTLVAVAPAIALMAWYDWSARTPILLVIASAIVGGGAYAAAILLTGHPIANEVRRLLKRRSAAAPA